MRGGRVPFLLLSNFILPGNLKRGDFFKRKPAYSRRERRKVYCHTRAVARRYPTDRTTTNKRVLGRKIRRGRDSSCVNFLTEILPGPALAGASLSGSALKLTQRCGLQIPTQHQAVGVAPKHSKIISKSKTEGFFKQKPAYSRRERRKEYCHTRAERGGIRPTEQQRISGF